MGRGNGHDRRDRQHGAGFIGLVSDLVAAGAHATLIDNATSDPGTDFAVYYGGTIEITSSTPSAYSHLEYGSSPGTFALWHPAATSVTFINDPIPGDVLELPGTSVSGVTFGTNSLSVTTDVGAYSFSNVRYVRRSRSSAIPPRSIPPPDWWRSLSSAPTCLRRMHKRPAVRWPGGYLWSNAANWSGAAGYNDTVVFADPAGIPATTSRH